MTCNMSRYTLRGALHGRLYPMIFFFACCCKAFWDPRELAEMVAFNGKDDQASTVGFLGTSTSEVMNGVGRC